MYAQAEKTKATQVVQKRGGSHGKTLMLNVQGTYDLGNGNGPVAFNDRRQDVSIVKGHGGYTNEAALAEAWVRKAYGLPANAVVNITSFNFFTAKS